MPICQVRYISYLCSRPRASVFRALPDDTYVALANFELFADDTFNETKNVKVVSEKIENIVGKGEKVVISILCSFFQQCFQKVFFSRSSTVVIAWQRIKHQPKTHIAYMLSQTDNFLTPTLSVGKVHGLKPLDL